MPQPFYRRVSRAAAAVLLLLSSPLSGLGAVAGVVRNGTSGQPQGDVPLTLMKFDAGMDPVGETFSSPDGSFSFNRELPPPAAGQPFLGAIRAEYQGVGYSALLRAGDGLSAVEITVYDAAPAQGLRPDGRIFLLEPGDAEMLVTETYIFTNSTSPPRTYRDPERGTLRFHLPPEARGQVRVQGTGPAGMPLPSSAEPAGAGNLFQVDFPIKPGENRIDLTYAIPHGGESVLRIRSVYEDVITRAVAPQGVELSGEGLRSMGAVPDTQTTIFEIPGAKEFSLTVKGSGRLRAPATSGGAASEGPQIAIQPAPLAKELPWILTLTLAILAIGFYYLYTAGGEAGAPPSEKTGRKDGRRKS